MLPWRISDECGTEAFPSSTDSKQCTWWSCEFYSYQLLWDREQHHNSIWQAILRAGKLKKIWIPHPKLKCVVTKHPAKKYKYENLYRHTHTRIKLLSVCMNLCTLTINQSHRERIHVSAYLNTKLNSQFKRLKGAVNGPNCVPACLSRCVYVWGVICGWLAGTSLADKAAKKPTCCLDSVYSVASSSFCPAATLLHTRLLCVSGIVV